MKKKLRHYLRAMLPDFWIMVNPYSPSWDAALNRLLDTYRFSDITPYRATLGEVRVWIANVPYGAFTPEIEGKSEHVRPSRLTIAIAMECLDRDGRGREVHNYDDVAPKGTL